MLNVREVPIAIFQHWHLEAGSSEVLFCTGIREEQADKVRQEETRTAWRTSTLSCVYASQKMLQTRHIKLPWKPLRHLLTSAALQLLTAGSSWGLFPVMAPPLSVVVNGERKTLVVCVVNDLSEEASGAVWFSNGNGSMLESFTYMVSAEGDGGFSTVSQLAIQTEEFESWDAVTCYVAQNKTSRMWNTTSLQISEESIEDSCLDENHGTQDLISSTEIQHIYSQTLLLLAIRMLLFKFLMTDVLITCWFLYKREDSLPHLKSHNCPAVLPYKVRFHSTPVQCTFIVDSTKNYGLQD